MNLVFNSYGFVFLFLPLSVGGFYLIPFFAKDESTAARVRKVFLTAVSVLYFSSFGIRNLLVFLVSLFITILMSWILCLYHSKGLFILFISLQVLALAWYKYAGLLTGRSVVLPLAVSFYTFTQISWLTDLYRGDIRREDRTILDYCAYITYFPKLLQGPITRFEEMKGNFEKIGRIRFDAESFTRALMLFIFGLFEKVILADTLAVPVEYAYSHMNAIGFAESWIITVAYPLELYLDFSAYCNMGRAVSRMLGMDLPENFDKPYRAPDGNVLWSRWHSSLNRFFVRYIYIPLGGSRMGDMRTILNMLAVFLISGLWHGSTVYFLIWAMMNAALAILTWIWQKKVFPLLPKLPAIKALRCIRTGIGVLFIDLWLSVTFMIFHGPDTASVMEMIRKITHPAPLRVAEYFAVQFELSELWYLIKVTPLSKMPYSRYYLMWFMLLAAWGTACLMPKARILSEKIRISRRSGFFFAVLFVWCIFALGRVTEFAYFAF